MGASWRPGAAALLLVLAAALAPPAAGQPSHINLGAVYQFTDPEGDVVVTKDDVVGQLPLGDADFSAVDVTTVHVYEDSGPAGDQAPILHVLITTAGDSELTSNYTVSFTLVKGPTSLPASNASGRSFSFAATPAGTQARAAISLAQLGAVGGDQVTGLRVTATQTDQGALPVTQDDQTGVDQAPDTGAEAPPYTVFRPRQPTDLELAVLRLGDGTSPSLSARDPDQIPYSVRLTNNGLDPETLTFSQGVTPSPRGADEPIPLMAEVLTPFTLAPGDSRTFDGSFDFDSAAEAQYRVTFTVANETRGTLAEAVATITVERTKPLPEEREVKPAGLTFLTGAAESAGFDDAFGSYAELALLALIVLLVILAIYLLLALGRTTLDDGPAPEAPWPDDAPRGRSRGVAPGPGGIAETVRASDAAPPALFPDQPAAPADAEPETDAAALAAAFAPDPVEAATAPLPVAPAGAPAKVRIEEVRHTPTEPDAGQRVTTEVLLRNEGPTASLRVTLSVDGKPAAERTVQVPSRATKAVELPWTAGPGDNRVRIQAFPA
jgi:hypothetical protein